MTLRPELEALPQRMKSLPVDRGYPVPWFVEWVDGAPEFRVTSIQKWREAVKLRLCWVCGQRLGAHISFVLGPMCGISRSTAEPPCHLDCAEWSARNCPFLARPHAERREMDNPALLPGPGIPILRNPGVTLVWTTRNYTVFSDGKGGCLIRVGFAERVSWWAEGKPATRAQIEASVESGLPTLLATIEGPSAARDLKVAIEEFRCLLP